MPNCIVRTTCLPTIRSLLTNASRGVLEENLKWPAAFVLLRGMVCASRLLVLLLWLSTAALAAELHQAVWDDRDDSLWGASGAIVSSNAGINPFSGLSINQIVGADRFYNQGYTGTRAVVTSIEGGHIWNEHETLQHVTQQFDARATYMANGVGFNRLGQADRHAVSNLEYHKGIAYGATLWSGSIATDYGTPPWSNNWGWSRGYAYTDAYRLPMLIGSNGRTTDVVNSSWGFFNTGDASITGGNNLFTVTLDGIV